MIIAKANDDRSQKKYEKLFLKLKKLLFNIRRDFIERFDLLLYPKTSRSIQITNKTFSLHQHDIILPIKNKNP